jgi:hypothetical protein
MTNPTRTPWNAGSGCLPQIFRIGDVVQVRQDGSAPADLFGARLRIIGVGVDESCPGRVCYRVHNDGATLTMGWMREDWLEAAPTIPTPRPTGAPPGRSSDRGATPATQDAPEPSAGLTEAVARMSR